MSTRFYYFGRPKIGRHKGIITMAVDFNKETKRLTFAMSFCSPRDQFCKRRGRMIAEGRLAAGKGGCLTVPDGVMPSTAVCNYFNNPGLLPRTFLPQWARYWVLVPQNLATGQPVLLNYGEKLSVAEVGPSA